MPEETFRQLDALRERERRVAMATLVATRGTSPRKEGAKMWVGEDGRILGSVTIGGCVDAEVVRASDDVLRGWNPRLLAVDLGDEDARELGLTCAGAVDVWIEPVELAADDDAAVAAYDRIRARVAEGGRAAAVTALSETAARESDSSDADAGSDEADGASGPGARLVVLDDGATAGTLGDAGLDAEAADRARDLLVRGISRTLTLGDERGEPVRAFFEVHGPPPTLVVFGAGHIAEPLVAFAKRLGLRAVVVDARERFASPDAFPDADELRVGIPSEIADELRYGPGTLVVLVAHDYKYDIPVLKRVLETDAGYVGMLGSRRRGETILRFLEEDGVPPEALERVRVPVGLDIGAETAPELAISILAEALAVRAGRTGGPMRERGSRG